MERLAILLSLLFICFQSYAQSQSDQALNLPEDNYAAYRADGDKFKKTPRPWGVSFVKNGDIVTAIKINRLGVVEELFEADLPEQPAYYTYEGKRALIDNGIIYYYEFKLNKADILYALAAPGKSASGNVKDWNRDIVDKQKSTLGSQADTRTELAEIAKAKEEAEIAAASLKDKKVNSLKIVLVDGLESNSHGSIINFGVEAIFDDGTISKTNSLGGKMPWDDLDIQISGGILAEGSISISKDADKIPADVVKISVKSKYHALSDTKEIEVLYNETLTLNYNGDNASSMRRGHYNGIVGGSLIIYAKKAVSGKGKPIVKLEIRGAANNQVLHKYKIGTGGHLTIYANGQSGMTGDKRHSGGNGGDGGNITIYADPSISAMPITVYNEGGQGSGNRENPGNTGYRGKKGTTNTIRQSVNINW